MVAKSNSLNASQFLLLVLLTLASFTPLLANAEDKKFEVSNNIKSAKAIIGSDKKLDGEVTFDPKDYSENEDRSFDLTVGECKMTIDARKDRRNNDVDFKFYNEKGDGLGNVVNPKTFLIQGQSLTFYRSNGDSRPMSCGTNFVFNPMEGDSGNFTLEVSLAGNISDHFALKSENMIYEQSAKSEKTEGKGMSWLYIGIGIGIALALLVASVVVGLCICKYRKKKAAAAKGNKFNELANTAISAEKTKMFTAKESKEVVNTAVSAEQKIPTAKEVSEDQKPTKEQTSAKDKKSLKTKEDQKPVAPQEKPATKKKPDTPQEKPATEKKPDDPQVNTAEEKPDALQVKTAEEKPDPPPIKLKERDILRLKRDGKKIKVEFEVQPTRHHRELTDYEELLIKTVKDMMEDRTNPYNVDEAIWIWVALRNKELAKQDMKYALKQAEERARMRTAEEKEADVKTAKEKE